MADDVKIKQADMLRSYSSRFTAFGQRISSCQNRMTNQLHGVESRINQQMNSLRQSEQSIEHQLNNVRNKLQSLMSDKNASAQQIARAQAQLEKLMLLRKKATIFVEQGQKLKSKSLSCCQALNEITKKMVQSVNENVSSGNNYVRDEASLIDDYKRA